MSTFGGDSWVPETLYRKRRVDELLGEEIQSDEVRRLSNGGLACLVCPNCPVLDTMPMLIIHRKGARHQAAAEKQREKKQRLHLEIQKRIVLGSGAVPSTVLSSISTPACGDIKKKTAPLLAATEKIKAKMLLVRVDGAPEATEQPGNPSLDNKVKPYVRKKGGSFFESLTENAASSTTGNVGFQVSPPFLQERTHEEGLKYVEPKGTAKSASGQTRKKSNASGAKFANSPAMQELRKAQQREFRLRESGWRRDGAGGWFRDENVEFDSDEEMPVDNV